MAPHKVTLAIAVQISHALTGPGGIYCGCNYGRRTQREPIPQPSCHITVRMTPDNIVFTITIKIS